MSSILAKQGQAPATTEPPQPQQRGGGSSSGVSVELSLELIAQLTKADSGLSAEQMEFFEELLRTTSGAARLSLDVKRHEHEVKKDDRAHDLEVRREDRADRELAGRWVGQVVLLIVTAVVFLAMMARF